MLYMSFASNAEKNHPKKLKRWKKTKDTGETEKGAKKEDISDKLWRGNDHWCQIINTWKTCKNLDKNARNCDGKITW